MRFEIRNGSFSYQADKPVLQNISCNLEEGRILAILGPNGVGKTTLLKCILGFLKWQSGNAYYDGKTLAEIGSRVFWQKAAYVPQARVQAFPYTVEETVLLGRSPYLNIFETPRKQDIEIAEKAMENAGVSHLAHAHTNEISGGELQLTLIARALAAQPQLLILDEPETGLDFRNQFLVLHLIEKLSRENHLTVIFNTHYPEHALSISDDALLLKKDGTALFGTTKEILNVPNMEETFGVRLKMIEEQAEDRKITAVIPLGIGGKV